MIFKTDIEIFERIEKPKNTELIKYAIEQKKKGELHILGLGIDNFIDTVDKIEDKSYKEVKKKLANIMTVPVFEKNLKPMTNIFTAKGGVKCYNIEDVKEDAEIRKQLSEKIGQEYTISEWLQQIWKPFVNIDPLGMSFVEIDENNGLPLLVYYSPYIHKNGVIKNFYRDLDFNSTDKLEYVIFYWDVDENENTIYRVIDDEKDLLILHDNSKSESNAYSIISVINHKFGTVPGCLNSTKKDVTINKGLASYCKEAFILADDYLNDYIDSRIYKKKLGIPRFWEFKSACTKCGGTGIDNLITDKNINNSCSSCHGLGYESERNLTDIFQIDLLERDVQSYIPPSGAVTLPTDIQDQMIRELQNMEVSIYEVIWGSGTYVSKEKADTTAFEISVRSESTVNKLKEITNNKIIVEKRLIQLIGIILFNKTLDNLSITAPTQYILNTGTEAMSVYLESKRQGAANNLLNQNYNEYLTAEYENNPVEYKRQKNLFVLEPYPHNTLLEIQPFATPLEFEIKKNFEKYIAIMETSIDISQSKIDVLISKIEELASINLKKVENASISEPPEIREEDI